VQFNDWELEIDGVTQETPNSSFDNESGADEQASISEAPTSQEATLPLVVSKHSRRR
jgi:hypothetical protein